MGREGEKERWVARKKRDNEIMSGNEVKQEEGILLTHSPTPPAHNQEENRTMHAHVGQLDALQKQLQSLHNPEAITLTLEAIKAEGGAPSGIPAPPPLPPVLNQEGSFVPPPPPLPFGECWWVLIRMGGFTHHPCAHLCCVGVPVPPPPPGVVPQGSKKPVIPNVPLPLLNWVPLKNYQHTVFKVKEQFVHYWGGGGRCVVGFKKKHKKK